MFAQIVLKCNKTQTSCTALNLHIYTPWDSRSEQIRGFLLVQTGLTT